MASLLHDCVTGLLPAHVLGKDQAYKLYTQGSCISGCSERLVRILTKLWQQDCRVSTRACLRAGVWGRVPWGATLGSREIHQVLWHAAGRVCAGDSNCRHHIQLSTPRHISLRQPLQVLQHKRPLGMAAGAVHHKPENRRVHAVRMLTWNRAHRGQLT